MNGFSFSFWSLVEQPIGALSLGESLGEGALVYRSAGRASWEDEEFLRLGRVWNHEEGVWQCPKLQEIAAPSKHRWFLNVIGSLDIPKETTCWRVVGVPTRWVT